VSIAAPASPATPALRQAPPHHDPRAHARRIAATPLDDGGAAREAEKNRPLYIAMCEARIIAGKAASRARVVAPLGHSCGWRRTMGRSASKPHAAVASALGQRAIGRSPSILKTGLDKAFLPGQRPRCRSLSSRQHLAGYYTEPGRRRDPMPINHTHNVLVALGSPDGQGLRRSATPNRTSLHHLRAAARHDDRSRKRPAGRTSGSSLR